MIGVLTDHYMRFTDAYIKNAQVYGVHPQSCFLTFCLKQRLCHRYRLLPQILSFLHDAGKDDHIHVVCQGPGG